MVVGLQQVYAQETTLKDDLSTLPNELLEKIFNQLDSKEKLELAKTNKILRSFVEIKKFVNVIYCRVTKDKLFHRGLSFFTYTMIY